MKKIMIIVMSIVGITTYAQNTGVNANNNVLGAVASFGANGANVGGSSVIINPPRPIDGTVYLFKGWENDAVIQTSKGMTLRLKNNINFNAMRNVFESKISSDSIFTFDFKNIEKMVVNNKIYENIYSPKDGGYRLYEVIATNNDFSIYKDYQVDIKRGNPNPMLAQINDKYVMTESYYVKKGRSFRKFKMKKSDFLKLAGSKADDLEAFAKKNRLSFKRDEDLEKIASYYATL